jgi:hypothetical protein
VCVCVCVSEHGCATAGGRVTGTATEIITTQATTPPTLSL